jgi:hypothetical protein
MYGQEPTAPILIAKDSVKTDDINPLAPAKAAFYSAILPGLGQAYNKKYWKIPIIYAGFGVASYFLYDQNKKYQCYRKSYFAMVDDDPLTVNTCDPNQSAADMKLYRDNYQKNYEYSVAGLVGFYLLVAADAFVDAHLKNFDISDDLTLKIKTLMLSSSIVKRALYFLPTSAFL